MRRASFLVTATALVVACGGSNGSSSGSDGGGMESDTGGATDGSADGGPSDAPMSGDAQAPTPSTECTAYANALCAFYMMCDPGLVQASWGGVSSCQAAEAITCAIDESASGTGWTSAVIGTCTTRVMSLACTDHPVPTAADPCLSTGAGGAGAPCGLNVQCASRRCTLTAGTPCGTCDTIGMLGDTCGGTSRVNCDVGLACSDQNKCVTVVAASATCDATHICVGGTECVRATMGAHTGTCTLPSTMAGATCSTTGVATAGCSADAGFFCDYTGRCSAVTYDPAGMSCGLVDGGVADNACASGAACRVGMCIAPLPPVAACTVGTYPYCASNTLCVANSMGSLQGTCQYYGSATCH